MELGQLSWVQYDLAETCIAQVTLASKLHGQLAVFHPWLELRLVLAEY